MVLVKLVAEDMINRGLQLVVGLNVDPIPFSHKGDCVAGGIYYCEDHDVIHWLGMREYTNMCTVTVPDDAKTVTLDHKYRSDKVILSKSYPIEDHPMWRDPEVCNLTVQYDGSILYYVKEQTREMCKLAVQQHGYALKYVREQTEELCNLAVQQNGYAIQYVKEQTKELCKLGVQQNGYALRYVKEQTEEICKLAIQQNGHALRYVKEQTEVICKLAIQQNGHAFEYVKEKRSVN
jgi:cation transport regulator ChaC